MGTLRSHGRAALGTQSRFALLVCGLALACDAQEPALRATPWPDANRLFQSDARFVGGDGAYSVDLGVGEDGEGRVLWLFGDSFIATDSERSDDHSYMVRNAVALQTGYDPTRAFMRFYWRSEEGHPASFIDEEDDHWFWPGHGIRVGDRLLLFYGLLFQEGEGNWGFSADDWTAFVVDNPDAEPNAWNLTQASIPSKRTGVDMGEAVLRAGEHLLVYGRTESETGRDVYLARYDIDAAMSGDLQRPEWWTSEGWGKFDARQKMFSYAIEFSVSWAPKLNSYVVTETAGFGATALTVRTAPQPWGPWSERHEVLRPPESFWPESFVYAGKAHPELEGADLVLTYVPSTFDPVPDAIGDRLYFPYFARLNFP